MKPTRPAAAGERLLADVVSSRRDEIVRRWAERVRSELGERLPPPVLIDSVPAFVDALAEALRAGDRDEHPAPHATTEATREIGRAHGEQRAAIPVDLARVIREYRILRAVVLRVAEEAALRPSYPELHVLSEAIDAGIAEAARGFTASRDAAVREAERAQELLELGDAFLELDPDWRVVRVNRNQERMSGMGRGEMLGRVFWELWPEAAAPGGPIREELHRVMAERVPREFDAHLAQREMWVGVSAYPVTGGGIAAFMRDVSRRKRDEARAAETRAFEQQLIGIVSHDLRNPLNAVLLGAAALQAREDLPERHVPAVARIRSAAERASRLIRDLLDFTRARIGGGIPIARRATDLAETVRQAVDEVQPSFADREVRIEGSGDTAGAWDPDRLAQVIGNLVGNALKYGSPAAPVTVRLEGHPGSVRLSVHNAGPPIPPELCATIFQPWMRGAHLDASDRGAGLGLYIVERIVAAHGGRVKVASSPGAGTTFTAILPR